MKKRVLTALLAAGCIYSATNAQIIGPSTTTVGVPTSFSSGKTAFTYHWDFNNVAINPTGFPLSTVLFPAGSFNVPDAGEFIKDPSKRTLLLFFVRIFIESHQMLGFWHNFPFSSAYFTLVDLNNTRL